MQQIKKKNETEREIDLTRLGQVLLKKSWLIVVVTLLFGLGSYIYSALFITPMYKAYFTAYVNNRISNENAIHTSTGDLTASMGLVYVYQDIITSRSVLASAATACDASYPMVANGVKASVNQDAPVVTVVVETEDPELSLAVAQQIAELAPIKVAEVVEGSSMKIIDSPAVIRSPSSPNMKTNVLIGFAIGFVLATLSIIVVDLFYDYVQGVADIERRYSLPVIGQIPDMLQAEKSGENYGYRKAGVERK